MNINSISTPLVVLPKINEPKRNDTQPTVTENKEETTIQSRNGYKSQTDKMVEILDEKYAKINEQNKQFSNPFQHILDKYKNPNSPYFRNDLTEIERNASFDAETEWLAHGYANRYDLRDSAFRDMSIAPGGVDVAQRKAYDRQQVNNQLQELFERYKINIPLDAKLTFTIDPNNHRLSVSGTDDHELIRLLEEALNSGNNAKQLFSHIIQSRSDDSTQFTREKYDKYNLVREIKKVTGLDLKDLTIKDGKFVTENGTDIMDIFRQNLRKNPYIYGEYAGEMTGFFGNQLYELAKNGFDSIPDLVLSISYENGSLRDIGQKESYGTGDTGWIDAWKDSGVK